MKIKATEPKELILAESAILQVLADLQKEQNATRDVFVKDAKKLQIAAITEYVTQVRDFIYLSRLRLANAQVMIHVRKHLNESSIEFEKVMIEKYASLANKNR